jgi:hypothetical protein
LSGGLRIESLAHNCVRIYLRDTGGGEERSVGVNFTWLNNTDAVCRLCEYAEEKTPPKRGEGEQRTKACGASEPITDPVPAEKDPNQLSS